MRYSAWSWIYGRRERERQRNRRGGVSHDDVPTDRPPRTIRRDDFVPVADYGLLADCNTAALVARDGSIDWLCLPRYDSHAMFARLLDPEAGHWSIGPPATSRSSGATCPAGW